MPNTNYMSIITLPVEVSGVMTDVDFTIKDAESRQLIQDLADEIAAWGQALKWIGVTTTPITDGDSTNPIMIEGVSVTAVGGNMTAYNGVEFVWDTDSGVWQAFGTGNLGTLAYQNSASGSFTPSGTVTVSDGADTTASIIPFGTAGTLPNAYFTVSGSKATLHFEPGTLPAGGTAVEVVTESGPRTATFTGTTGQVTVS